VPQLVQQPPQGVAEVQQQALQPPPAAASTQTRGVLSRSARPVWLTDW
jgi:hypothetical protein